MINVTDNAVRQLRSLLAAQAQDSGRGLRVRIAKGGCSGLQYEMALDEKKDGDAVGARWDAISYRWRKHRLLARCYPGFPRWFNRRWFSRRQSKCVANVRMRFVVRHGAARLKPKNFPR